MTAQGVMFKFTYRADPKRDPDEVFDVVKFFAGTDPRMIKYNAKNHAQKSGAIAVTTLTQAQYEDLLNEETQQTTSSTAAKETNQAQCQ